MKCAISFVKHLAQTCFYVEVENSADLSYSQGGEPLPQRQDGWKKTWGRSDHCQHKPGDGQKTIKEEIKTMHFKRTAHLGALHLEGGQLPSIGLLLERRPEVKVHGSYSQVDSTLHCEKENIAKALCFLHNFMPLVITSC